MRIRRLAGIGAVFLLLGYLTLYLLLDLSFPSESQKKTAARLTLDFLSQSPSCINQPHSDSQVNIQMLRVYDELKFDNIDGGAWKQGWNIVYNENQWSPNKKLKVYVVPHSHNDPGWKKTFEDYYQSQTRSILNNMVVKLMEDPRRKFIWAEISFFSLWWQEITDDIKAKVKTLLTRRQLEIVTGGWVMNDEANAHYYSILQQLTHGHQWMQTHLNITPRFGWAIDPFGHSPTMPYVLKKMGIESILIQRTHYSIKKYLAKNKQLEFRWRQVWDYNGSTDLLTHMMPFYSYDAPHSCGPDPKVCCQFDFKRLPGYGFSCPWRVPPQIINDSNVAHRAEMILDQWRKKAQLFSTDVVIAPLGDDFRYDHPTEWDLQFNNYQRLFDYMNNVPHLNVQAQFGTLSDYFDAIQREKPVEQYPSLSGDFFTYADRDDHYWSGYYTSRPFYKRMDRVLQDYLRSADLVSSEAWLRGLQLSPALRDMLHTARSSLALFQHHDGVTGTAKDHVVQDYANKMLLAIKNCQHVIQLMAHYLLSPAQSTYKLEEDAVYFDLDHGRKLAYSLPGQKTLVFNSIRESHRVVIYNSLSWVREEVVTLRVSTPDLKVTDWKGNVLQAQVDPHCQLVDIHSQCYELSFVVTVEALGMSTYFIYLVSPDDSSKASRVKIKVLNSGWTHNQKEMFEDWVNEFDNDKEFTIQNQVISAAFSKSSLLKAVTFKKSGKTVPLHLNFVKYSSRPGRERSGAYLFLPDGEGENLRFQSPLTLVFYGQIMSKVFVQLPNVKHTVILYNSPGADGLGLEVHNLVDISSLNTNYELVMRISSNINNKNVFHTDLNGLQMIKRKRFSKLPLQANYYPMPTAMYIEDDDTRLTLLSAQPLGVASLREGQIEVMQDRRLLQDDNRGLDQGVLDNRPTLSLFRLIIEEPSNEDCSFSEPSHTEASWMAVESLNHPLHRLIVLDPDKVQGLGMSWRAGTPLHPDIRVVSLSVVSLPHSEAAGLVVHRTQTNNCFAQPHLSHTVTAADQGKVNISSVLSISGDIIPASLSFVYRGKPVSSLNSQDMCPYSMLAFLIPNQTV
ncbi:alpha-mannosidase 2 isoform X2 [Macrosteles quadrilineatus]|uniref:alpha-mannosidase 2 isoform X2 n=1 Tax=Macrosteles quadrilineatus TaxID=74068 RepID=UPI0023E2542E|nr:alpha-mannosidase 2 isoform X2 [Macrosteles quadrilineatus]